MYEYKFVKPVTEEEKQDKLPASLIFLGNYFSLSSFNISFPLASMIRMVRHNFTKTIRTTYHFFLNYPYH